jgi:hypothetical protein
LTVASFDFFSNGNRGDVPSLLDREITVIGSAYLLAAIPVAAAWLAGQASPLYRVEDGRLRRWWSWMALIIVLSALTVARF